MKTIALVSVMVMLVTGCAATKTEIVKLTKQDSGGRQLIRAEQRSCEEESKLGLYVDDAGNLWLNCPYRFENKSVPSLAYIGPDPRGGQASFAYDAATRRMEQMQRIDLATCGSNRYCADLHAYGYADFSIVKNEDIARISYVVDEGTVRARSASRPASRQTQAPNAAGTQTSALIGLGHSPEQAISFIEAQSKKIPVIPLEYLRHDVFKSYVIGLMKKSDPKKWPIFVANACIPVAERGSVKDHWLFMRELYFVLPALDGDTRSGPAARAQSGGRDLERGRSRIDSRRRDISGFNVNEEGRQFALLPTTSREGTNFSESGYGNFYIAAYGKDEVLGKLELSEQSVYAKVCSTFAVQYVDSGKSQFSRISTSGYSYLREMPARIFVAPKGEEDGKIQLQMQAVHVGDKIFAGNFKPWSRVPEHFTNPGHYAYLDRAAAASTMAGAGTGDAGRPLTRVRMTQFGGQNAGYCKVEGLEDLVGNGKVLSIPASADDLADVSVFHGKCDSDGYVVGDRQLQLKFMDDYLDRARQSGVNIRGLSGITLDAKFTRGRPGGKVLIDDWRSDGATGSIINSRTLESDKIDKKKVVFVDGKGKVVLSREEYLRGENRVDSPHYDSIRVGLTLNSSSGKNFDRADFLSGLTSYVGRTGALNVKFDIGVDKAAMSARRSPLSVGVAVVLRIKNTTETTFAASSEVRQLEETIEVELNDRNAFRTQGERSFGKVTMASQTSVLGMKASEKITAADMYYYIKWIRAVK